MTRTTAKQPTPPTQRIAFGPWAGNLWCWDCTAKTCIATGNRMAAGFSTREKAKKDAIAHDRLFHDGKMSLWERIPKEAGSHVQGGVTGGLT